MTGRKEHRVFLAIRHRLLLGQWPPESRLRPTDLAAALGVSASPAREALARLAERGLVTSIDHLGFMVAPLDPLAAKHHCGVLAWLYADSIDRLAAAKLLGRAADQMTPVLADIAAAPDTADAYVQATAACRGALLITHYQATAERLDDMVAATAAQAGASRFYAASLRELAALPVALRRCDTTALRRAVRTYFKKRATEVMRATVRRAGLPLPPGSQSDPLPR